MYKIGPSDGGRRHIMKGQQNQGCGVFKIWDISMNFINPVNLDYKISKIKNLNISMTPEN